MVTRGSFFCSILAVVDWRQVRVWLPRLTTQNATRLLPGGADLAAVIDAWDRLPEGVHQSVMMLVKAASGT
jgi:hypothetical protein